MSRTRTAASWRPPEAPASAPIDIVVAGARPGPVPDRPGAGALAGTTLAAIAYTFACPPHQQAWLAWLVPPLLLLPTRRLGWRAAAAHGALFSLLMGWGVTGWAYQASLEYFDFSRVWSAVFAAAVWLVYGGVPYAATFAVHASLGRRLPPALRVPFGAWIWVVAELLRATLFTGMPWELLGHSQFANLTLIQIADLGGVTAISATLALVGLGAAEAALAVRGGAGLRRACIEHAIVPVAVLTTVVAYGVHARRAYAGADPHAPARTVTVVQGNVPNEFRWNRLFFERTLGVYAALSMAPGAPPDLIVWPENAANFYINREPLLLAQIGGVAARARDGLLVGGPRLTDDGEARNAAYLVAPDGRIAATYDKRHLVPLAEYNPFRRPRPGDADGPVYTPGAPDAAPLATGSLHVGTLICYEVLFPDLVRDLVRRGADVLVNLSNDGWLDAGDGAARAQHLSMAVFRAVETRRQLVRAAATGVSGFVDPVGRISRIVPGDRAGASTGVVVPRTEITPYVRWGDAWVLVAGAALVVAAAIGRVRA